MLVGGEGMATGEPGKQVSRWWWNRVSIREVQAVLAAAQVNAGDE